jgi:hypothetical protein
LKNSEVRFDAIPNVTVGHSTPLWPASFFNREGRWVDSVINFIRRHKTLLGIVVAIVLSATWYLFRPEKLFINQRVDEAAPFAAKGQAQPIYTGKLNGKLHETSGRATIYRQPDGMLTLRLSDFHTSDGPDVHVVLAATDEPALQNSAPGKALTSIEVSALKGNEGDQDYTLPAKTDLARYNTVVIYCERFRAVFGAANLQTF